MNWLTQYQPRVTTAEEAVKVIGSGRRVFLTGNCSVPQKVLGALVARAAELTDVEITQVLTIGEAPHAAPGLEKHLRINTLFISDNVRAAVNEGRADFTPCFLSEVPLLFRNGHLPIDVALIHVSPPDEHGFCSLGIEAGLVKTPAQMAQGGHRRSQRADAAHAWATRSSTSPRSTTPSRSTIPLAEMHMSTPTRRRCRSAGTWPP